MNHLFHIPLIIQKSMVGVIVCGLNETCCYHKCIITSKQHNLSYKVFSLTFFFFGLFKRLSELLTELLTFT